LPNTKVKPGAALWGAAVAALVWSFAKYGFSTYVTQFIPYSKIYGVLGLIPLSVFWIHISWLIALFGLQLTYTTQHLKTLDAAEIEAAKERKQEYFITNDLTVINVAREIAEAFERREGPMSPEVLWSRLDIPTEFGDLILDRLLEKRLLLKTYEPSVGFVPARAPEHITLAEIAEAVAAAALAQPNLEQHETLGKIVRAQQQFLAKHNLKEILDPGEIATPGLSDVPEAPPDGPPAPPA
jgi:membrane protein